MDDNHLSHLKYLSTDFCKLCNKTLYPSKTQTQWA